MTTADIFAVGAEFRFPSGKSDADGKPIETVLKLRKPTLYEQGAFQRWLEQRAHDAVDRSTAGEDAKDRRHAVIDRDAALGKYEWDGPIAMEAKFTPAGLAKCVAIICRDQGATDASAEAAVAYSAKRVAAEILGKRLDPKRMRQVLDSLGLPVEWADELATGSTECEPSTSSCEPCSTRPSDAPSPNSEGAPTTNSCSSTTSSAAPMG